MLRIVSDKLSDKRIHRLSIAASDEEMRCIDEWRRVQPDLPGRSEAIRRLVRDALEARRAAER